MKRWLLNFAAAVSLVVFVAVCGLWVRSLRHFEIVDVRYARWTQADELRSWFFGFSWYSDTLRAELIWLPMMPQHFRVHPGVLEGVYRVYPPGCGGISPATKPLKS